MEADQTALLVNVDVHAIRTNQGNSYFSHLSSKRHSDIIQESIQTTRKERERENIRDQQESQRRSALQPHV